MASNLYLSPSIVHKDMRKVPSLQICLFHRLVEDDFDQGNEFCKQLHQLCNGNDYLVTSSLNQRSSSTYLGVTLNVKLTHKSHLEQVPNKAVRSFGVCR